MVRQSVKGRLCAPPGWGKEVFAARRDGKGSIREMENAKILVVEDDNPVRSLICTTLKMHGYEYLEAENGNKGLMMASSHNPSIILVDLGLPDMDGTELIRQVRTWSSLPILVISARSDDSDKIEALDSGADDYITKPFSVEELLARLRATFRRLNYLQNSDREESSVYVNGPLSIDYAANTVCLDQEELHLTQTEYRLLCLLAKNTGKVLTYKFITRNIWGSSWENNTATLRVVMTSLRKKLSPTPQDGEDGDRRQREPMIQTHVGIGYRMVKIV